MKKTLLFLFCMSIVTLSLHAQKLTKMPNPGFEKHFFQRTGEKKSSKEIFAEAALGNKKCEEAVQIYHDHLSRFLSNIANVLDPHYFVLGGGMSNQDVIYEGLEALVSKHLILKMSSPKIYKNTLGDSAGVLGAALLPSTELNL
jgi:fructokinase